MSYAGKLNSDPLMDVDEKFNPNSAFKNGIDRQREIYKFANLESRFDEMSKALENIKIDIKCKAKRKGLGDKIIKAEKILDWYGLLETKYTMKTAEGVRLNLPNDIKFRCSKNLHVCYEILSEILTLLDLI